MFGNGCKRMLKQIRRGIKNLIDWFPIIWRDRDYDYGYLLYILQHKLKRMQQFLLSDKAMALNAPQFATQIKVVLDALERVIKNEYFDRTKNADIIACFELANRLQAADLHIVFNTMEEKVIEWWD